MKSSFSFKAGALSLLTAGSMALLSANVQATPAFARQQKMDCGGCHTAFPSLNATGRMFKQKGYRFVDASQDKTTSSFTDMVNQFPLAANVVSRPFIKDRGAKKEIRAIHELEMFAGGILYKNVSGFLELEAEGEDGFGLVLGAAALNYDINDAVHFQVAYAPTFFADPYDTLSDGRRLTVNHYNITNEKFGGVDSKMRHARQQVSVFGHLGGKLFYNVGAGGLTDDKVGSDSTTYFGRVAFEATPDIMIGAFGLAGTCELSDCTTATKPRDFNRYGVDSQVSINQLRMTAVYMNYQVEDTTATTKEKNTDWYLQGAYFMNDGGLPTLVPIVRYESTQKNDGNDTTGTAIANLTHYFTKNAKGMVEYSQDITVPSGANKEHGLAVQVEVAF